ncbi:uncharacterized protein LOC111382721 [Olea europaea var. sylvestris]|uniref:uncharacterized protein LOC111382721 n=1 Tax=Olea europaea var. sylvestris TaxID=158386 RepID=UPI000C1CE445|nr:uncharacterized protein LOC111382721 [Olea europaea var. sylvestris]
MKIGSWNIRGFNPPLKQNGVKEFMRRHEIDVMGILETKLNDFKLSRIIRNKFGGLSSANNFRHHKAGCILVLSNSLKAELEVLDTTAQVIHCSITCKVTSRTFLVNFVYAFHTIVNCRPLWDNIEEFGLNCTLPWLALGDFNNVLNFDEKSNGADVTPYEIKDFEMCCQNVGLTDMRSIGCFYTWNNNSVWSKIDRAMVNGNWMLESYDSFANFLPSGCLSDHSPCIVSIFGEVGRKKRPFKFFNMWTCHEDFHDVYQMVGIKADYATKKLELAQVELHNDQINLQLKSEVARLRKEATMLCEAERNFYYQQSKCVHLKNSDKCTKYFHSLVKRNAKRNEIPAVIKRDGNYSTSQEEAATEFTHFYSELLGQSGCGQHFNDEILSNGPKLSGENAMLLVRDFTRQEIKDALFSIGDDKSPEFFATGSLLKQTNHTIIALVPKGNQSTSVEDYRPIACCNVFYKVITKILASRLKPMLDVIVDKAQTAFVEGRSMIENIHLAQEQDGV